MAPSVYAMLEEEKRTVQCMISFRICFQTLLMLRAARLLLIITTTPFMIATKIASSHTQPGTGVEDGHSPTDTLVIDHHKVVKGNGA